VSNVLYNPTLQLRLPGRQDITEVSQWIDDPWVIEGQSSFANARFTVVSWNKDRGYHLTEAFGVSQSKDSGTSVVQINLSTGKKLTCLPHTVFPLLRYKNGDTRVQEGCVMAKDLKSGDPLIACSFEDLTCSAPKEVRVVRVKPRTVDDGHCFISFDTAKKEPVGVSGVLLYPY